MSKLSGPKEPSPILDMRKQNNLTIITDRGVEYQAKVIWTDMQVGIQRDILDSPIELGSFYNGYAVGRSTYTFELTAVSRGPVTRVQR